MGNNTKALEYANKVINSGKYTLLSKQDLPKYPQFVPESNSETILRSVLMKPITLHGMA